MFVFCALAAAPAAPAAFPGKNGKIVFQTTRSPSGWYLMNADGSAPAQSPAGGVWSADGKKFVFTCSSDSICIQNADGTGVQDFFFPGGFVSRPMWSADGTRIVYSGFQCGADFCDPSAIWTVRSSDGGGDARPSAAFDWEPAWSPDGLKIAFASERDDPTPPNEFGKPCTYCNYEIYTMNVNGTGQTRLTNVAGEDRWPSWSPDGTKLVFTSTRDDPNAPGCAHSCKTEIYLMNADGTGVTRLTSNSANDLQPSWSPDGTKILFVSERDGNAEVYVMNPDGSGQTNLTNDPSADTQPDWQPIPINGYPRPKGATTVSTNLTIAYEPCTSNDRQHGPPLAALSCSSPTRTSDYLTVGTLDSNGQKANSAGLVQYDLMPGNLSTPPDEADVKLTVLIKDIRNNDLSDYPGELSVETSRRITDKDNTPSPGGPGAATVQDLPFRASVPCATSPTDATIGSLCSVTTTVDTLVPGSVKEGRRSIWELSPIKVYDGGSDGDADTSTDNTLFMDEGIFTP